MPIWSCKGHLPKRVFIYASQVRIRIHLQSLAYYLVHRNNVVVNRVYDVNALDDVVMQITMSGKRSAKKQGSEERTGNEVKRVVRPFRQ